MNIMNPDDESTTPPHDDYVNTPEYMESPQRTRNPSPPPELRENVELIHGDNIGDTAFSRHWLFSTLMKLIQEVDKENEAKESSEFGVDVDEDLQNELCKLWDMSMNPEVAVFLQEFKAVDILSGVIAKSKAPRVTEICVGILANMACNSEICGIISKNERLIEMIILMLGNDDTPTLVETTRLVYTCLSDKAARQAWISTIKAETDVFTNICFILHSSTNSDLLKNVGECVDELLDSDDDLCLTWTTQELVESLLEAVKQIGYSHSQTLETFMHIFQLLSTSEQGVASLVACADVVQIPLLKYLLSMCEYEIVGLVDHVECLASALSVLNVLFTSSPDVVDQLSSGPDLMRILLKILEPLFPLIPGNVEKLKSDISPSRRDSILTQTPFKYKYQVSTDHSTAVSHRKIKNVNQKGRDSQDVETKMDSKEKINVDANVDTKIDSKKDINAATTMNSKEKINAASNVDSKKDIDAATNVDSKENINVDTKMDSKETICETTEKSISANDVTASTCTESTEIEIQKFKLLYGVIQGFLVDVFVSMTTDDDDNDNDDDDDDDGEESTQETSLPLFISVLEYMEHACSRCRLNYMLISVTDFDSTDVRATERLQKMCDKYKMERLSRIVQDFNEGNLYFRSNLWNEEETT